MINLAQTLSLVRPLAVVDLEATGALDNDRIIQIAITIHYHHRDPIAWKTLINPEIPIPREIQEVHGISDEAIAHAPKFKDIAAELVRKALTDTDYAGQHVSFDLKMLRQECRRVGVAWDWETTDSKVIDTLRILQVKEPRDLSTLYERFVGQKLKDAHDAGNDVAATEAILEAMLKTWPDLPRDVHALGELLITKRNHSIDRQGKIIWRHGEACIGFGKKWMGTPLRQVDRGYLKWMLKEDFPPDTKAICEAALAGRYPEKP
jgi:DNA polymerase III subunit epsilon